MVSIFLILSLIFCSFSLCFEPSETVPCASSTIGITVTLIFNSFFSSITSSIWLYFYFLSFLLCGPFERQNPLDYKFFRSYQLILGLKFCHKVGNAFVSQNPREYYYFTHWRLFTPAFIIFTQPLRSGRI